MMKGRTEEQIITIALLVLVIAVFEGAVRKWFWGGATLPLLAARDALIAYGVLLGAYRGCFRSKSISTGLLLFWSMVVVVWTLVQLVAELQPPIIGVLGIRSWLLYAWFALLCSKVLNLGHVERILRFALLLAIPMTVLAVAQHYLPYSHPLNRQADDAAYVFTVARDIVRVTGTFTFTAGYVTFVAFVTPAALAVMIGELPTIKSLAIRALVVLAFTIAVVVSGSRAAFIESAILLAALLVGMLNLRKGLGTRTSLLVVSVAAASMVVPVVFNRALEATAERFEAAARSESLTTRVLGAFGQPESWQASGLLGRGIGMGNNAAPSLMGSEGAFLLGEAETDKMLLEAGLLGMAFTVTKWLVAAIGSLIAFRSIRRHNTVLPWLLWVSASILLVAGNLTSQLTAHAFGWLTIGLAAASLRPRGASIPSTLMTESRMRQPLASGIRAR